MKTENTLDDSGPERHGEGKQPAELSGSAEHQKSICLRSPFPRPLHKIKSNETHNTLVPKGIMYSRNRDGGERNHPRPHSLHLAAAQKKEALGERV